MFFMELNFTPKFSAGFDTQKPFSNEKFFNAVFEAMKFQFKLYGIIPFKLIYQDENEIDLNMGEIHITEMDLKKISEFFAQINKKFGTQITYCIYHSTQFPGDMLLNIRGPNAPMLLSNKIKFSFDERKA